MGSDAGPRPTAAGKKESHDPRQQCYPPWRAIMGSDAGPRPTAAGVLPPWRAIMGSDAGPRPTAAGVAPTLRRLQQIKLYRKDSRYAY